MAVFVLSRLSLVYKLTGSGRADSSGLLLLQELLHLSQMTVADGRHRIS